jgi:hypothetical protein
MTNFKGYKEVFDFYKVLTTFGSFGLTQLVGAWLKLCMNL